MKNILITMVALLLFLGCSPKEEENTKIEPKIVTGKSLSTLKLNDQFENEHAIDKNTTKVIFAFSEDTAHACNDFFVTQSPKYLDENNAQFIADVSSAPSVIRSMFIMPGLKDFKHTVLIIEDKETAEAFKAGIDVDKIIIAFVDNGEITQIKTTTNIEKLKNIIESK